jgi:hypothetical protein
MGWRAALVLLAGLMVMSPMDAMARERVLCRAQGITVHAGYERARAANCRIDETGTISLDILPETRPINDSPWYGFAITLPQARTVAVRLTYTNGPYD